MSVLHSVPENFLKVLIVTGFMLVLSGRLLELSVLWWSPVNDTSQTQRKRYTVMLFGAAISAAAVAWVLATGGVGESFHYLRLYVEGSFYFEVLVVAFYLNVLTAAVCLLMCIRFYMKPTTYAKRVGSWTRHGEHFVGYALTSEVRAKRLYQVYVPQEGRFRML